MPSMPYLPSPDPLLFLQETRTIFYNNVKDTVWNGPVRAGPNGAVEYVAPHVMEVTTA